MPELADPEGDKIETLNVRLGGTNKWVTFEPSLLEFTFNGDKAAVAGVYRIYILITDDSGSVLDTT